MSRSAARTAIALTLALALGGGAGLRALHPCPHHATPGAGAHGGHADGAGAVESPFRSDAGSAPASEAHPAPDAPADPGPCTCIGTCHASAAAPLPAAAGVPDASFHGVVWTIASLPTRDFVPARNAYLLPFANAPPTVA